MPVTPPKDPRLAVATQSSGHLPLSIHLSFLEKSMSSDARTNQMKTLSPKRNTSDATTAAELTAEQLKHFHIEPDTEYGQTLSRVVERMYESQGDISHLWQLTLESMNSLDQNDRIHPLMNVTFNFTRNLVALFAQHNFRRRILYNVDVMLMLHRRNATVMPDVITVLED